MFRGKSQTLNVYSSDSEIVSAINEGSETAYEVLFKAHYQRLCTYACSILKDMDDAEEVVQSVFLNIWEKRTTLEITTSLKSYLYRAVHNYCMNRIKHLGIRDVHREHTIYYQSEAQDVVNEAMNADELELQIERAILGLPEQCRLIFRMSRFEELRYQEIADRLHLSVKTVENQIGKALKILRGELSDYLLSLIWLSLGSLELTGRLIFNLISNEPNITL